MGVLPRDPIKEMDTIGNKGISHNIAPKAEGIEDRVEQKKSSTQESYHAAHDTFASQSMNLQNQYNTEKEKIGLKEAGMQAVNSVYSGGEKTVESVTPVVEKGMQFVASSAEVIAAASPFMLSHPMQFEQRFLKDQGAQKVSISQDEIVPTESKRTPTYETSDVGFNMATNNKDKTSSDIAFKQDNLMQSVAIIPDNQGIQNNSHNHQETIPEIVQPQIIKITQNVKAPEQDKLDLTQKNTPLKLTDKD